MNTLQQIIHEQTWIKQATSSLAARTALGIISRQLPKHIRHEMKQTAKEEDVKYLELLCCNLSYELAIVALSCNKVPKISSLMWSLGHKSMEAAPVGCTTVGIAHTNGSVEMYRNLDWDDPNGLLKDNTQEVIFSKSSDRGGFSSLTFPGFSGVLTGKAKNGAYAVAINAVCIETEPQFGAAPTMLLREVFETCRTYKQAKKMLSETVLMCSVLFTLVGANGKMVTIERSANNYAHRHPVELPDGRQILITANSCMVMDEGDGSSLGELSETSDERFNDVLKGAKKGLDIETIMDKAEFGCTIHTAYVDLTSNNLSWWQKA